MTMKRFSLLALLALASCATHVESNPARTAREELLISTAADRAADRLKLGVKPGTKVFVDPANFDGTDIKYALGAVRASFLKQGVALVSDKKDAEMVVEPRAGALSIDQDSYLVGIPAISIPIPLTSGSLPLPELAIYKKAEQRGVAKFAATAFTAKDGNFVTDTDAHYGFSHSDEYVVLFVISWDRDDTFPDEEAEQAREDALSHHAPRQGTMTRVDQPASK